MMVVIVVGGNLGAVAAQRAHQERVDVGPVEVAIGADVHLLRLLPRPHHDPEVLVVLRREEAPTADRERDGHGPLRRPRGRLQLQDGAPVEVDVVILLVAGRLRAAVAVGEDAVDAAVAAVVHPVVVAAILVHQHPLLRQGLDAGVEDAVLLDEQRAPGLPHPLRFQTRPLRVAGRRRGRGWRLRRCRCHDALRPACAILVCMTDVLRCCLLRCVCGCVCCCACRRLTSCVLRM
mmetsp:Transcript_26428/g.73918  ORF Transcript_26428/g.73918 Transcript_26428/m.73918 type:complete len:234 (-) Transcript_26428:492-1193(-)